MRRFAAWYGKEVRGHRGLLVVLVLAIPALTFFAGLVYPGLFGVQADSGTDLFFLAVTAALVVLATCGDLFSREREEGTLSLVRRLPGALAPVFAAKVAFLASVIGGALLWQAASLVLAWSVLGRVVPDRSAFEVLFGAFSLAPHRGQTFGGWTYAWHWLWAVALLAAWGLLGSTWFLRGGAALGAGVVLLGLIAAPYAAVEGWEAHVSYRQGVGHILSGGLAALALAAAAWSFLGGARYVRSAWAAVSRGALVLLLGAGAAHAWVARDRVDLFDLRPGRPGVTVDDDMVLGADGRNLFLTSRRSLPPLRRGRTDADTAWFSQAYVVDLTTGGMRALGDVGSSVSTVSGHPHALVLDPAAVVRVSHRTGDRVGAVTWTDARTAEPLRVLPEGLSTDETDAWTRAELMRGTRCRDAQGRPVWLRSVASTADVPSWISRGIRREWREGSRVESRPLEVPAVIVQPLAGGWRLLESAGNRAWLLAAHGGESFPLSGIERRGADGSWWRPVWVGEDVLLAGSGFGRGVHSCPGWRAVTLSTGAPRDLGNPPCQVLTDAGPDTLLVTRRVEERLVTSVWNPVTGEDRPCPLAAVDASSVATIWGTGWGTGDGRRLIEFTRVEDLSRRGDGTSDTWPCFALFDPTSAEGPTLRWLRTTGEGSPIALREDGALLVLPSDRSRVEWWGPQPDHVERIPFGLD